VVVERKHWRLSEAPCLQTNLVAEPSQEGGLAFAYGIEYMHAKGAEGAEDGAVDALHIGMA
jgi:hypothetical protein